MISSSQEVTGVDEVGRGCLFGPVFAGTVVLDDVAAIKLINAGLKDSKVLNSKKRASLVPLIQKHAKSWALGQASAYEIDTFGIRAATERAMLRSLKQLPNKPSLIFVDGLLPIRLWDGNQNTLVRGESQSPSIAAASVLAKEARDALIKNLAAQYPGYGLETNVGYGTKFHRKALLELGASKLHRKSFLSKIIN